MHFPATKLGYNQLLILINCETLHREYKDKHGKNKLRLQNLTHAATIHFKNRVNRWSAKRKSGQKAHRT